MSTTSPAKQPRKAERYPLFGVPEGYDSVFLAETARKSSAPVLHITSDDVHFEEIYEALTFFAPDVEVLRFPAWDCLPYDRISPTAEVVGERLKTLSRLLHRPSKKPLIVLTTISAATQRASRSGRDLNRETTLRALVWRRTSARGRPRRTFGTRLIERIIHQ